MGKRKKMKKGAGYMGFRMGCLPQSRVNLKALENAEVLTSLQHDIVQKKLDACKYDKKDTDSEGNEVTYTFYTATEKHQDRLKAILAKPFNEAKVDGKGNDWEKPVVPTQEEIEKMNEEAVENGKKGKSRKDLEEENATSKDNDG